MKGQYIRIMNTWEQETRSLTSAEKGRLIDALIDYQVTGEYQQPEGNERFLYPLLTDRIRKDNEAREQRKAERQEGQTK